MGRSEELRVAGRLVGVRFRPSFGPKEGIEIVPPRRETPIRPGDPDYTGNPHTDFRIEPDPQLSVRDDLERRDFTVNAMARDIHSGAWIDPFGGREDLAAGDAARGPSIRVPRRSAADPPGHRPPRP